MSINKKIKNKIDNLKINDEFCIDWKDFFLENIEDCWIYTLESIEFRPWTLELKDYKFLDYGDLFDLFYLEEMEENANL